jgi:predicted enzyme related to lactoylglutathione lyase
MGDPVVYFEVLGGEPERLREFYGAIFGWGVEPVESTGGGYGRVGAQDAGIQGGSGSFPGAPSYVSFYVKADDLDAAVARANELGGHTVMEPRSVDGTIETALIEDPDGHMIGLIKGL